MNTSNLIRIPLLLTLAAAASLAGNFSFTGTLGNDSQAQLFSLSLANAGIVTVQSYGYGGGVNFDGATIAPGGFDSYLTGYAEDGTQTGTNDDGCGTANSTADGCLDALFSDFLDAGTYTLALTVSGNGPVGTLSQGFTQDGNPNFTCPAGFCDVFSNQRNGNWAVDILGVDFATSTPEPATFLGVPVAMAMLGLGRRLRRTRKLA